MNRGIKIASDLTMKLARRNGSYVNKKHQVSKLKTSSLSFLVTHARTYLIKSFFFCSFRLGGTGEEVTANALITAETSSCKSSNRVCYKQDKTVTDFDFFFFHDCDRCAASVASKTLILIRGLKDMEVKKKEEQRTCPPDN